MVRPPALGLAVALGAFAVSCASPGMPPGGPPDVAAPVVTGVSPDSNAVRVKASSVTLRFDEVVSERTGGSGRTSFGAAGTLDAIVRLSPGDGRERVSWRRTAIEVEPRGGFRANTTYRLTLLPGLADLRGNAVRRVQEFVFSTGDSLATGELSGAIFDWAAGRAAPLARVEAFVDADTSFRWITSADSSGRFTLRDLAPARYHVRAWVDATANRQLDEREAFDSTTVAFSGAATNDFYVFVHDTLGPRVETVESVDSTALRVRFDRATSLEWAPDSFSVVLQGTDSSRIAVGVLVPAARYDSLARLARAAADSARAAADANRAPADSAKVPAPVAARVAGPRADTLPTGPKFGRAIPVQTWVVPLRAPLAPGEYRLTALRVEGLTGARRTSERAFRINEPPKPVVKDSTAVTPPPARPPRPPESRSP